MKIVGLIFGFIFIAIGVINMFWGNDPGYGIFVFVLAFAFFPWVGELYKAKTGYRIHPIAKVLLGAFLLWSALGVGELFDKIGMMMKDLSILESEITIGRI